MSRAAQFIESYNLKAMDSKNFLIQWIRHFAQPNSDIARELLRIHGNSINSFVKAIKKAQEQYFPKTQILKIYIEFTAIPSIPSSKQLKRHKSSMFLQLLQKHNFLL
jgi:hypothetical protein